MPLCIQIYTYMHFNGYMYMVHSSSICDYCLLAVRMRSNFGGLTVTALLNSAAISLSRRSVCDDY